MKNVTMAQAVAMFEHSKYMFMYDLGSDNYGEDPSTEAATVTELVSALESGESVRVYEDTLCTKLVDTIQLWRK